MCKAGQGEIFRKQNTIKNVTFYFLLWRWVFAIVEEITKSPIMKMRLCCLKNAMANYYKQRSVSTVNYLLIFANDPKIYIEKYQDKIIELLRKVDVEHQQETIENIKRVTGITIKL
jgi:hypothetical protein